MAKYSCEIRDRICQLIENDSFTIPEICKLVGISVSTFHEWRASKLDFSDAVKKARDRFSDIMVVEAKRSLRKLICGYDYTESATESVDTGKIDDNGNKILKVKKHVSRKRHVEPNTVAIIFALTNLDPSNWQNRSNNRNFNVDLSYKSYLHHIDEMSDEELQAEIEKLKAR